MSVFLDRPDDLDAAWTWAIRQPGLDWETSRSALRDGRPAFWIRRMGGGPRIGLVVATGEGRASLYLHPSAADAAPDLPAVLTAAGFVGGTLTDFVPALADAFDGRLDRARERQWWTLVPAAGDAPSAGLAQPPDEGGWFAAAYDACYGGGGATVWNAWAADPQFRHRRVWFLVEAGAPVAFYAATRERAGEEWIRWIGTRPERRRQGLGLGLLRGAVARAVAEGTFSASIVLGAADAAGRGLARAAGFHRVWRRLVWGRP